MDKQKAKEIFNELYKGIEGYRISLDSRAKLNISDSEFVYGEIDFDSFSEILDIVKPDGETIFYDLGSGTGKPCIAISLLYKIKKAVGIELLPDLCETAQKVYEKLKKIYPEVNEIEFRCENFLESDFSDGNLIFIQATCCSEKTMTALEEKFEKLKMGTKIIIITKQLKSKKLNLIFEQSMKMGWGTGTVRIYEKIA